ncbi:hypothetical protein [Bradyrhizobium sp. Ai1a-2]|uniref:hypothetical protein n=1 Tax=Bradyrhizobium sp. Ai1a-2 TaxID=196490 RepID=UPI0003F6C93A|nr:hypothetical protein [Bradyrhizobium sp. Ai1a-2]
MDYIKALKDEIDGAMPVDMHAATALINGSTSRQGLRAKYHVLLDREWGAGRMGERLHGDTAQRAQSICDFVLAQFRKPVCEASGWNPYAGTSISELKTEEDKVWAADFAQRVVHVEFE